MGRRRDDSDGPEAGGSEGVLLEFRRIGGAVKVSAVDPATGTEVSITGPASAGEAVLSRIAARKLRYVLARRRGARPPDGGGGVLA